ncbi:MAG: sigma-70 family RNA polymerase sigma factor [Pyrinomonadaceae bacterium]|nr:sigma-70 family RNA polymerase sigma factor [Pyrinomonadaceae bacterium]
MDEAPRRGEITEMLKACSGGNREAMNKLVPFVYQELHRQAHRYLNRERSNHTLQTTALVHEAYLRLIEYHSIDWQNRAHFFGMAANMMRRILVNYAVSQNRLKRGGSGEHLPLEEALTVATTDRDIDLLSLDKALNELEMLDERQAQIVELRYFSGLNIEETAEVLQISPATVKRDWNMAKAWLRSELGDK